MARLPLVPPALHTTERPSRTAQWTTLVRALELGQDDGARIVTDHFAPLFLSATSTLCRHRFIDAQLLESLPEVSQVVILGAGYDSRAYRFAHAIGRRAVYEIDLAPISRRKASIVAGAPERFGPVSVRRLEIDFRTQSVNERIGASDFRLGAPTFVAWEGVSMYLTRADVARTLDALALVGGRGSVIAMDFWRPTPGDGALGRIRRAAVRGMALIGEPITFSVDPADAPALFAASGFDVIDLATALPMTKRYATGRRHCDEAMFVAAARLR